MSPRMATQTPSYQNPKLDCPATTGSSESFNFSDASTYDAGFNLRKTDQERPNVLRRSRPRMAKLRRKQTVSSRNGGAVEFELGLNGTVNVSRETELDIGVRNVLGSTCGKNGDLDGNGSQFENSDRGGLGSGVGFHVSRHGFGVGSAENFFNSSLNERNNSIYFDDGAFTFSGNNGTSKLGVEKKSRSFDFGATKDGSKSSSNEDNSGTKNWCSGHFVFGAAKSESGGISKLGVNESFEKTSQSKATTGSLSGSDEHDPISNAKLDQEGVGKPGWHVSFDEFDKLNDAGFDTCACTNGSMESASIPQEQDSCNAGKNESCTNASHLVPDLSDKVKLDTFGEPEKIPQPCFQFSAGSSHGHSNNHGNFVFGSSSGIPNNFKSENTTDNYHFTNSGNNDAESETKYQRASFRGAFVFGGSDFYGDSNPLKDEDQSNIRNTDVCNGIEEHNRDIGLEFEIDSKIRIDSGGSFEKCPVSSLSEEMKKLNIENSEAYGGNSNSFSSEFSVGTDNVFVFKSNCKDSSCVKQVHPTNISGNIPCVIDFPKDDTVTHVSVSSLLATPGSSDPVCADFSYVPYMKKGDKDNINFTHNMNGFDAAGAEFHPPNQKFDFSNIFSGTPRLDHANNKSLRTRRLKKKNVKLQQRSMVKQLFSHNTASRDDDAPENHKSPGHSSPMDFSPHQETELCNTPAAASGPKDVPKHRENPNDNKSNLNFPPSLHAEDGLSTIARQYKKKYKMKAHSSHNVMCNKPKEVPVEGNPYELCEHWRKRGNQAYREGKISEAEECYTLGINTSAQYLSIPEYPTEPFSLCYSNRAATRMTLGRMREAIEDCKMASALDPNSLKITLRAGNCYLVLGEVEDAIQCFSKCLGSGTDVCLDRRLKIEAADGLQKAKSVAEKMCQSSKLLQEGTTSAADSALGKIAEALAICHYSESLLKMKAEALWILRRFDEVIQLCNQTIDSAKTNLVADQLVDPRCKNPCELWRCHLLIKSHYHMGRLDMALDLIEQENIPLSSKPGNANDESPTDLANIIRRLLCLKKSGNDAFRSGKFAEAIEHYNSAITRSVDSRPFMAICFCNRAAAYQSIYQVVDAILDCSLALALDENYQKAISRRATLHEMIRDYKQAADDLQRLISLLEKQLKLKNQQADPQSKSSGSTGKDLRRARRQLSTIEEKANQESPLDFYLILGIKATDTESEIKKAYRKAALKHHPDKAGHVLPRSDACDDGTLWKEVGQTIHDDADRLFKIIGEAYSVLSDPSKRSKYDSEEEMRNICGDSNKSNNNSGHPYTSYSSPPYAKSGWSGKSEYGRNNRRYWSYSGHYSQPRW